MAIHLHFWCLALLCLAPNDGFRLAAGFRMDTHHVKSTLSTNNAVATKRNEAQVHTQFVVDPYFAGVAMSTSIVAKAANAVVAGLRLKQAKENVRYHEKAVSGIAKRKSETCFLARTFQMQAALANGLILGYVDAATQPGHQEAQNVSVCCGLDQNAVVALDRNARKSLTKLGAQVHDIAQQLASALERLVQTACHTTSVNEFGLLQKVGELKARIADLEQQLAFASIDALMEIGISFAPMSQMVTTMLSGGSEVANPAGGMPSTEILAMKSQWDAVAKLFVEDLDVVAKDSPKWAFFQGSLETLLAGLGAMTAVFVGSCVWFQADSLGNSPMLAIYASALDLLVKGRAILKGEKEVGPAFLVSLIHSLVTLACGVVDQIGGAGANVVPGMRYAQLTLKALKDMLQLAEDSMTYAEERRESAMLNARAQSTAVEHALRYTKNTCSGLYQVHDLGKKELEVIFSLTETLGDDPSIFQNSYDHNAAAKSYTNFCYMYPGICNRLSEHLATESCMTDAVKEHADTLERIAQTAPISDLAFVRGGDIENYFNMGFHLAPGLRSLMACRGCGSTAIFQLVLVTTAQEMTELQQAFVRDESKDGQKLPKGSMLNFVQYSETHHHIAFYKAPVKEILKAGLKVLVDVREVYLRLDDQADAAEGWRAESKSMLEQASGASSGVVVMSWDKEYENTGGLLKWLSGGFNSSGVGPAHRNHVSHTDTFSGLVATFLPSSMFPRLNLKGPSSSDLAFDWRNTVPTDMDVPFTHASVLEGCGCKLLFSSEYATFLPDFVHKDTISHVRVASKFEPNEHDQKSRCGRSVGLWVSSAPLTIPQAYTEHETLPCKLVSEAPLAFPMHSVNQFNALEVLRDEPGSDKVYMLHTGWWKKDSPWILAKQTLPAVDDEDGWPHDREYYLVPNSLYEKLRKELYPDYAGSGAVQADGMTDPQESAQKALDALQTGGAVQTFVDGLNAALCDDHTSSDVSAGCSFADEDLEEAVAGSLLHVEHDEVSSDYDDYKFMEAGARRVEADQISVWKSCDKSKLALLPEAKTLQELEEQLGGPIPVISNPGIPVKFGLPRELFMKTEKIFQANCEFTWWAVVTLCPNSGPNRFGDVDEGEMGYAYADPDTGALKAQCNIEEQNVKAGPGHLGPARKIFLRFTMGEENGHWKNRDKEADAVAMRDGFVLFTPTETTKFTSPEMFGGKYLLAGDRHLSIQAYVQIDPRIKALRSKTCPHQKGSFTLGWPDLPVPLS